MALLLFLRIGVVFQLIGLHLISNGSLVSVKAGANVIIPGPHIRFEALPPPIVIISQSNRHTFLPCLVSIHNTTVNSSDYELFSWYRNGERISSGQRNDFQILQNGTLKIPSNENSSGIYRCVANGTAWGVGAIISPDTVAHYAVLQRLPDVNPNITAELNHPLIIQCPIASIPSPNITWFYNNRSIEVHHPENRFFQIQNGSLLINSVKELDKGRYKCIARNSFHPKKQRQFTWTLSTTSSPQSTRNGVGKLLSALQNSTQYVMNGGNLKLYCAAYSDQIEWYFNPRNTENYIKLRNNSNEVQIDNIGPNSEGYYQCRTTNGSQDFNVIVTSPPVIQNQLKSMETSLSAPISFSCQASGSPSPNITWYRNGIPLLNGFTVRYDAPTLRIYSVDIEDEGIYQCFAKNIAGETVSNAFLGLRRKEDLINMPGRPENVKCYPVNYKTLYVEYESSSSLSMMSLSLVTEKPFKWVSHLPQKLHSNSSILVTENIPQLKPFMLFMRGMVTTSTSFGRKPNGQGDVHTFDVSLLSDGLKCSTQGLNLEAIFFPKGIFIWWQNIPSITPKMFIIQFYNNDTANLSVFTNNIIGTRSPIYLHYGRHDIEAKLVKIPVVIKTYTGSNIIRERRSITFLETSQQQSVDENVSKPQSNQKSNENKFDVEETIIEAKVSGDVTGMLIPNIHKVTARVLVITAENENIDLDTKYVEWKTIENSTDYDYIFKAVTIEARSVVLGWNPPDDNYCIKVCYISVGIEYYMDHDHQQICQDIVDNGRYFVVRKLKPSTTYRMDFIKCNSTKFYGSIELQTSRDAPGPISNQKIIKNNGLQLLWDPPINPNGRILYYNIRWTMNNSTYEANVTSPEDTFKFPNVTEDDKINVTIRAVGESGIGAPIFLDLRNIKPTYFDNKSSNSTDPTLGIALGVLLSILCVSIFIWIFIRQRSKFKSRANNQSRTSPSELNIQPHTTCNIELHEIQTLIPQSDEAARRKAFGNRSPLPNGNGIFCRHTIQEPTEIIAIPNIAPYNFRCDDDNLESNPVAVCSSTPILERKKDLSERLSEENGVAFPEVQSPTCSDRPTSIDKHDSNSSPQINKFNKIRPAPNLRNGSGKQTNGNAMQYHNGSIKTILPPHQSDIDEPNSYLLLHSNSSPDSKTKHIKTNGNSDVGDYLQYSTEPDSYSSIMDNSNRKLIDTTLDSSTINNIDDSVSNHHSQPNNSSSNMTTTTLVDMDGDISTNGGGDIETSKLNGSRNGSENATATTTGNSSQSQLNSKSSSNPIYKSNWNYRRPVIDPNG